MISGYTIPYSVLPLQDCVDLATFLIRTTMTAQSLAKITRCRWCHRRGDRDPEVGDSVPVHGEARGGGRAHPDDVDCYTRALEEYLANLLEFLDIVE